MSRPGPTAIEQIDERVLTIEFDRETDERWIAEVVELPGVLVYADSQEEAGLKVESLALRVLADRFEQERVFSNSVRFAVI